MRLDCFECGATVEARDLTQLGDRFLAHAGRSHDWPYPDQAIRNYAEATERLTGPSERLADLGELTIHPVTEARLDDWVTFLDHEAFVGRPATAWSHTWTRRTRRRTLTCRTGDTKAGQRVLAPLLHAPPG